MRMDSISDLKRRTKERNDVISGLSARAQIYSGVGIRRVARPLADHRSYGLCFGFSTSSVTDFQLMPLLFRPHISTEVHQPFDC